MIGLLRPHLAAAWRRKRVEEEIVAAVSMRETALAGIAEAVIVLDAEVTPCTKITMLTA